MATTLEKLSSAKCFGGYVNRYQHFSTSTQTTMKFHVFIPAQAAEQNVPVLYWLSGLTCTDENFIQKAGAQRQAAERGIMLVVPDTSPRGANIEGESESWDFGVGAGFYVNATEPKWSKNYRMFDYITVELPEIIKTNFAVLPGKQSIFGHSMGGHGALVCAMKNPGMYKSVSAFAPISNPVSCPWGVKAFTGYLGSDQEAWKAYDATHLIKQYQGPPLNILIDQGTEDNFLKQNQLLPENFQKAADEARHLSTVRFQEGYDHSYWFIQSFIGDHIDHHAQYLFDNLDSLL
eukprot:GILK01001482.1.p1 GENE.GILK01001482.1~~GILK01001482.1.p1  ORF type:complete len:305 (-),score=43.42 GILK01001482.1:268-1140(-)